MITSGNTIFHLLIRSFRECECEDSYSRSNERNERLDYIIFCLGLRVDVQTKNCVVITLINELLDTGSPCNGAFLF